MGLLFEVFDLDCDNCLQWEQLQGMFIALSQMKVVFEDADLCLDELVFRQELAIQEGFRNYERVRWQMQRMAGQAQVDSEVVNLHEIWDALQTQQAELRLLLPGYCRISWVSQPATGTPQEAASQAHSQARKNVRSRGDFAGVVHGQLRRSKEQGTLRHNNWHNTSTIVGATELATDSAYFRRTTENKFREFIRSAAGWSPGNLTAAAGGASSSQGFDCASPALRSQSAGTLVREVTLLPAGYTKERNELARSQPFGGLAWGNSKAPLPDISMSRLAGEVDAAASFDTHKWGSDAAARIQLFSATR